MSAQTLELVRDFPRAQHPIDAARFDGVAGHVREPCRVGSLREDDPTLVLDGLDAKAAIGVAARQHDTNRVVLIFEGERPEQRINGKVVLECGPLSQMKASIGHRERRIRRDDIDVIGLHDLGVERQGHRNSCFLLQDLGKQAFVARVEMLNDDIRHAGASRESAEQLADSLQTTGRGADADGAEHHPAEHSPRSSSDKRLLTGAHGAGQGREAPTGRGPRRAYYSALGCNGRQP